VNFLKKEEDYIYTTLRGFELSQVTPVCPHKSFSRFQFKSPFEVNELYQFTNTRF